MYTHSIQKRVRYGEVDQMGYLYYGNYAMYYEIGRVELMRSLGLSYKKLEEDGIMMPVLEMQQRYFRAALYDEYIDIRTSIKKLPSRLILFDYELFNEQNELINTAIVKLCFIDRDTRKIRRAPDNVLNALTHYF